MLWKPSLKYGASGRAAANRWYKKGYRTLSDLKDEKLTAEQTIGVKYYEELQEKIPREEVDRIFKRITTVLGGSGGALEMELVGSHRRGAENSSDIDVLMTIKDDGLTLKYLVSRLVKEKVITE